MTEHISLPLIDGQSISIRLKESGRTFEVLRDGEVWTDGSWLPEDSGVILQHPNDYRFDRDDEEVSEHFLNKVASAISLKLWELRKTSR
jgi:hypothetical protein